VRPKPLAFRIHRWLGLALAPWILAVALSGTVLAFRAPLEAWLDPALFLVPGGAPGPARFDRMAASVTARYPDRRIIGFARDGLRPDESFQVDLTRPARGGRPVDPAAPGFNPVRDADLEVFVNPATGAILGARPFWGWVRTVYWLHKELLAPFAGAPFLGVLGVAFLGLLIAGLVYWWPRPGRQGGALRIVTGRGLRRLTRDAHAAAGAVTAALLLTSAATGVFMCYEIRIERLLASLGLARAAAPAPAPTAAPAPGRGRGITIQQAADAARRAYPAFEPVLLGLPFAGGNSYSVQMFPRNASRVWWTVEVSVNRVTGQAVGVFDPSRQPAGNSLPLWVIFLHNGQMFGLAGRLAVLAEGVILSMLVLSGPWLWWTRRRAGRAAPAG
jgi:uncharacterized iron-regulated membrane protein